MSQFFSGQLSQLAPYTPGEQPKDKNYVKLNANESPYPPSPGVAAALNAREVDGLRLYSDATAIELKTALASQYGVRPENVFVSNGSTSRSWPTPPTAEGRPSPTSLTAFTPCSATCTTSRPM